MNYKFKNSAKNDFAVNLLLAVISAMLIFISLKVVSNRATIVIYALSIAVSYCRIAVEAIEKLMSGKIHSSLISTVAVLIIFASQEFMAAATVAVVYSVSKAVFDFICSCFSEKLLDGEEIKPYYNVVCGESLRTVSVDELAEGDIVKVSRGEYLAFDYICEDAKGEKKNFKAGKFHNFDEAEVVFTAPRFYEIDFEESEPSEFSKSEKIISLFTRGYIVVALAIAVIMFALKLINGGSFTDALFIFGVFLLFVNPLSINSGVFQAGLFARKNLKNQGVSLESVSDVEKLSRVKKVLFADDAVVKNENRVDEDVVKAVKIADVLKVETELLCGGDEREAKAIASAAGFAQFESDCDEEKTKAIIAEQVIKGGVAYVSNEKGENTKNVLYISEETACKKALPALVKGIKSAGIYKWFVKARVALGALINFAVIAVYASGIGDEFIKKMLGDSIMEREAETFSIKEKLIRCFVYNDMLAPWVIGIIHFCVINILLFVTVGFLNNNKKLR